LEGVDSSTLSALSLFRGREKEKERQGIAAVQRNAKRKRQRSHGRTPNIKEIALP
jgi:hypothetical protein